MDSPLTLPEVWDYFLTLSSFFHAFYFHAGTGVPAGVLRTIASAIRRSRVAIGTGLVCPFMGRP